MTARSRSVSSPENNDLGVVDAARELNLMLMRKGPTLQ
jgi:hypothetical protein